MGFFDSLRRILSDDAPVDRGQTSQGLSRAWSLSDTDDNVTGTEPATFHGGEYDRKNWRKKLKLILDELPSSRGRWADHIADAHAMAFEPDQIKTWCRDEFTLLVRRIVADRVVTEAEHRTLDLARDLLAIPDAEAEQILHDVAAEAEDFFGKSVEGA